MKKINTKNKLVSVKEKNFSIKLSQILPYIKKNIDYSETLNFSDNLNNLSLSTEDSLNEPHNLKYMYDFMRDSQWTLGDDAEKLKKTSPLESFHRNLLLSSNHKNRSILTYNVPEKYCPIILIHNSDRVLGDNNNNIIFIFVTRQTTENYKKILKDIINNKFHGTVKKSDENIKVTNNRIYYFYMNKLRDHMMYKFAKRYIKKGLTDFEINELGKKTWASDKFLRENKGEIKKHINLFLQQHPALVLPEHNDLCFKYLYNTEQYYRSIDGKPLNWIACWLEGVKCMKQGQGKYTHVDGSKYEGNFKDDKSHGKGTLTFVDGSKYEGEFKNGLRDGKGIFNYIDGSIHEGRYKKNKRHGKGIYTFVDGAKYIGEYKSDMYHGKGIYIHANGEKYEGEWKENKKSGKGIVTYKDGRKFKQLWKDGKKIK